MEPGHPGFHLQHSDLSFAVSVGRIPLDHAPLLGGKCHYVIGWAFRGATPATRVAAARGSGEVHARSTMDPAVTIASRKLDRHRRNPLPAGKRPIPLLRHVAVQLLVARLIGALQVRPYSRDLEGRRREVTREVAFKWLRLSQDELADVLDDVTEEARAMLQAEHGKA
jgi:hypothetical protein